MSDRHDLRLHHHVLDEPVSLRVRPDRRRTLYGNPEINRRHDDALSRAAMRAGDERDGEARRRTPPSNT